MPLTDADRRLMAFFYDLGQRLGERARKRADERAREQPRDLRGLDMILGRKRRPK